MIPSTLAFCKNLGYNIQPDGDDFIFYFLTTMLFIFVKKLV